MRKTDFGQLSPLIFTLKTVEWGKWVFEYFNFSFRERIGVIILAFLILFCFFLPRIIAGPGQPSGVPDTTWVAKLRALELKQEKEEKVRGRRPEEHWASYQYDRPADFIPPDRPKYTDTIRRYPSPFKKTIPAIADINTADTSAFIALPGIGSKLANRIVNFREKLGGFYSVDQIGEVYGLADSMFQKIRSYLQVNSAAVRKINLNSATIDELKAHPYIRYNIAKPIIAYREQHGPFAEITDIKKIMLINDSLYNRIELYLSVD